MEVKTYRMKLKYSTGLPTKDETSETIVRKLCCLVYLCNFELVIFFAKSYKYPLEDNIQGRSFTLRSSYLKSFRSSLQFHPLWVTLYSEMEWRFWWKTAVAGGREVGGWREWKLICINEMMKYRNGMQVSRSFLNNLGVERNQFK